MSQHVEITFDCIPLRSVGRLDVPIDATPQLAALVERVKQAAIKHGLHNTYYLHRARCAYHLTNDPDQGLLAFGFEGTVMTDAEDRHTLRCDLDVHLEQETCDWLTEPIVTWFTETVSRAVRVEFDRYISAGDLNRTVQRIERIEAESDAHDGFLGMGL